MGATAIFKAVGTGISAYGSYKSGSYNQKLADYNAGVSDLQAQDAVVRGLEEEQRHATDVKKLIGSQRADYAGQGVDVNSGSALEVQRDSQHLGELDMLAIRNNAAREAWGYKVQATDYTNRGRIAKAEGNNRAVSTLLTGGYSIAKDYRNMRK